MANWKKILTEDDVTNTNLGSSNLTSSDAARTFTLASGAASFTIKNNDADNLLAVNNSSNNVVTTSLAGGLNIVQDYASSPNQGYVKFYEGTAPITNHFSIAGPLVASVNQYMHLPRSQPSVGQVLKASAVDGTNPYVITTEWADASGTTINNNADNRVITGSGTAGTLEAESNLQYNGSTNILTVNGQAKINDIYVSAQGISSTGDIGVGSRSAIAGSSSTTTVGKVHYYTSVGAWAAASANTEAHNASLIAIARGGNSSNGMCLEGFIKPDIYNTVAQTTTFAVGKAVYLNANASVTTEVPSTSGSFARILGHATSTTVMYFRPSNEYVEIA
jgi:hypothetical protein